MIKNSNLTDNSLPAALFVATALIIGFSGCATSDMANAKHATVCPDCKTVAVPIDEPYYYAGERASWFGRGSAAVVYRHQCPRCHGSMETFAREGQWKHKCSICEVSPYTCPIVHPRSSRLVKTPTPPS